MLARMSQVPSKRIQKVRTLEQISMEKYLMLLQDVCAGYIQLLRVNTHLLRAVRDNILAAMKTQLRENLFGTMSTVLRQEMIDIVLSGKFPTKSHYSAYETCPDRPLADSLDDFGTDADRQSFEAIRKHGKKCNSVCCTGAFVIEAMLAVLVNEDIRSLRFERPTSQIYWNRDRFLRKYVPLQIPAVLAHYDKAVANTAEIKIPKLEQLIIRDTNIISRSFAIRNSHFDILTTYTDTDVYLEIPGALSAVADPESGMQYGGYSEHLMMMLGQVFRGLDRFERMTEIFLDSEACNTLLKMSNHHNRCISHDLFQGIGLACPNLRVLDLSNGIAIAAENLIQLFFRDGYSVFHQFVYLPEYRIDESDDLVQVPTCPLDAIHEHDLKKYCPWCADAWCSNGVRCNVEWTDTRTPIIDDRLYDEIEAKFGDKAKKYLVNVLKASNLIDAIYAEKYELVRPPGPKPWEEGFVPPGETPFRDHDWPWYMPSKVEYQPTFVIPVLNKITESLQCLRLNSDNFHPKHEIVPFLLYVLPNVKTLGRVKVIKGLKMIRDIPALNGITADHLEELDMTFGGHEICNIDTSWAHTDISELVEDFGDKLNTIPAEDGNANTLEELRNGFSSDIKLVAEQCPNLKSLRFSIFGETVFLRRDDFEIWKPVGSGLLNLRELILNAHTWSEVDPLLTLVGPRLIKLHMMLEGRVAVNDSHEVIHESQVPKIEVLLSQCPNIEHLTLSFGMRSVDVTQQEMERNLVPFPSLKSFTVHTYMTKKALEYLWARTINLESIKIPYTLVTADHFPHEVVEFTEADLGRLIRSNKMSNLRNCCTSLTFKNIESAKFFIESLPHVKEISKLSIVVGLPQDHYPSEEQMFFALAQVMQSMRRFKQYCGDKLKLGQRIKWRWSRTGALESLATLGPLQGLVDMSDEEP